ncbi:general repressor of transcription [Fusarium subglutinans]|uniref:General repressor of transcription n=1 Tax=Gibberella subglutinans TaxID=42677 RepID=A0A8H5Q5Q1_GIBSU|nr:general repressor of transcription [Fusarium subglutinans]KAF5608729.1 general repressor of transcription [Fusarium subglutinans]
MQSSVPVVRRRAAIACSRCRQMRSKCVRDRSQPLCKACFDAGVEKWPRGLPDYDRNKRRPRVAGKRAAKTTRQDPGGLQRESLAPGTLSNGWENLPPPPEIVDGINQFTRHYFQLGFIPKEQFPRRLLNDRTSVSVFLVVSILSISARLSRPLSRRYGSGIKASEFFMKRATEIALGEIFPTKNTLENCQAFYLLSIAQQGNGLKDESHTSMGLALRIASAIKLHLEQTYAYETSNPTPNAIILRESARRTLDQLHSCSSSPISLAASDIDALLPCDEEDFANGREPPSRAALEGTPRAIKDPSLVNDPNRSLFGTLIQAHGFWGVVTRDAVNYTPYSYPWDPESKFAKVSKKLDQWERSLPPKHQWSMDRLSEYKAKEQDLAYLGITMIPRLCNIILRRPYLEYILTSPPEYRQRPSIYDHIACDLFNNVHRLYEQIVAQFTGRSSDESVGAQMAAFCVYTCGLFSIYLWRYPHFQNIKYDGEKMFLRSMDILKECKEVWPLASRWVDALSRFSHDPNSSFKSENGMADGRDPTHNPLTRLPTTTPISSSASPTSSLYTRQSNSLASSSIALHSSPPNDSSVPISTTHIMASHFSQPQIQQHLQIHSHPHQPPLSVIPQQQAFVPPQLQPQLYMSPNNIANFDMVLEGFDPNVVQAYPMASQGNAPLATSISTVMDITSGPLNPPLDGFLDELNYYSYGSPEWIPTNNLFEG